MIRFIHAADAHIDSPLKGLEAHDGAPVDVLRGATRRFFENLIQLAPVFGNGPPSERLWLLGTRSHSPTRGDQPGTLDCVRRELSRTGCPRGRSARLPVGDGAPLLRSWWKGFWTLR